jgi:hypothetical protein
MKRFLVIIDRLDEGVRDFHIVFARHADLAQEMCLRGFPANIGALKIHVELMPHAEYAREANLRQISIRLDQIADARRDLFLSIDNTSFQKEIH